LWFSNLIGLDIALRITCLNAKTGTRQSANLTRGKASVTTYISPESAPRQAEELRVQLERRAVELWGSDRANAIAQTISQTALHVARVAGLPSEMEEEPGFYF
jgi:hypothetical protein